MRNPEGSGQPVRPGASALVARDPNCHLFRLAYRPPYDWHAVLAFLEARATPGVESVEARHYRRTIRLDGTSGLIDVYHDEPESALLLEVRFPDPGGLLSIVERVRRTFDLESDPSVIAAHLASDSLLRGPLASHPGIRMPGAWDRFELAVRAVLGQQVSVRGATTIAGRMALMFGSALADDSGLNRLSPTPAQLAAAPLESAGVMPARAHAIRVLARRVCDGTVSLGSCIDGRTAIAALRTVPGIGAWTAEYIAMRAFGEADAFPSGDRVLRRAAGNVTARELDRRADAWRPWRASAVMLLWQQANDERGTPAGPPHAQSGRSN
ncbi:MAG: hypothetical protein GEU82_18645 [Luteitalea sp.]|nr:hypothetical protein [Luteitalea sp.]